jgi:DNA-binding transcriptional regulator YhcF (GntR family)
MDHSRARARAKSHSRPGPEPDGSADRSDDFLSLVGPILRAGRGGSESLEDALACVVLGAYHAGRIRPGDRLPSIREIARLARSDKYSVVKAYGALERMRLVEKRERSGVFVAPLDRLALRPRGETAVWLTEVLAGAFDHHIRIPYLPELLKRWTSAASVRCACIESDLDSQAALCGEIEHQFGLDVTAVPAREVADGGVLRDPLPEPLHSADLLVTTSFHVPAAAAAAEALERPLLVATLNPEYVRTVESQVASGRLSVVCVDPRFGDRVRALLPCEGHDRLHVVPVDDADAVAGLDPAEPVLLTRAARERLRGVPLRLLVPCSHIFSAEFAVRLSAAILELNGSRGREAPSPITTAPDGGAVRRRA